MSWFPNHETLISVAGELAGRGGSGIFLFELASRQGSCGVLTLLTAVDIVM